MDGSGWLVVMMVDGSGFAVGDGGRLMCNECLYFI